MRCLRALLEVLLERGRLRDRLALVRLVHERLRVARVGHAAGAELALALVLLGLEHLDAEAAGRRRREGRRGDEKGKEDGGEELHCVDLVDLDEEEGEDTIQPMRMNSGTLR